MRCYSDASKYLPQEGAVNGVVGLLEINGAHEKIRVEGCPLRQVLQQGSGRPAM